MSTDPRIHRNWKLVEEVVMKVQKDENLQDGKKPINYLHSDGARVSNGPWVLAVEVRNRSRY